LKLNPSKTILEIATLLGRDFVGNPNHLVTGINEIHRVELGDLSFVDHPKYYNKALQSAATTLLINQKMDCPEGKGLIFSDTPFDDYNFLTKYFRPFQAALAQIAPSALIGEGTILQPGVFVGNQVKIGKNCILHPNVVIYDHCEIGDNVEIHANAVIGSDAYYFKRKPEGYEKMHSCGRVILEDNVEIGACCTIDKGVSADTIIGKGTKLDNHVHIGHDTLVGQNVLMAAQVGVAGVATIEDDVILWGQVGVSKDLTIGKGAIVFAQSGVPKSIEGGKQYFGSPVQEAKEKMKELVWMKRLPELFNK
jgi:UDP-3-O-[3-hydroxymyristoyl] glucosamine N-acyltransferase